MTDRGKGGDSCNCTHHRGEHEYIGDEHAATGACEVGDCDCECFSLAYVAPTLGVNFIEPWVVVTDDRQREYDHRASEAGKAAARDYISGIRDEFRDELMTQWHTGFRAGIGMAHRMANAVLDECNRRKGEAETETQLDVLLAQTDVLKGIVDSFVDVQGQLP